MAGKAFNLSKGVFSFNGRKGNIIPDPNDYTPEMIGAAKAPLSSDVTLYVNGTTGSDENPGSGSQPFKTIQAAINSLPKNLGEHSATINVENGTYNEDVTVIGFYNGYNSRIEWYPSITIAGDGDGTAIKSIDLRNCRVSGATIRNVKITNPGETGVLISNVPLVVITTISIENCAVGIDVGKYYASGGSNVYINSTTISGSTNCAVLCQGINNTYCERLRGSNNAIGLTASYGGTITSNGQTMTSTTAQSIYAGFVNKF